MVERRLTWIVKKDYLGIADVVAIRRFDVLLVQATSNQHVGERLTKLRALPHLADVLKCGVRVEVWGWWHDKPDPRIEALTLDNLHGTP